MFFINDPDEDDMDYLDDEYDDDNLLFDGNDEDDDFEVENEFGEIMTREEMIAEMDAEEWEHDLDEDSTDKEVKEEYVRYHEERYEDAEYLLFPNGRDEDAEDEDGPLG